MSEKPRVKLVIAGDKLCGKTSLMVRFSEEKFNKKWTPHEFCHRLIKVKHKGEKVVVDVWETPVYEKSYCSNNMSGAEVVLLCFSLDKPETLENVARNWISEIESSCPKVPIILVGNKADLRDKAKTTSQEDSLAMKKRVSPEQGRAMAEEIGAYSYYECSAKSGAEVDAAFMTAIEAVLH